jgi:hypothetical protein
LVVEHSKCIVAEFRSRKPGIRRVRKAAEEVLKVPQENEPNVRSASGEEPL